MSSSPLLSTLMTRSNPSPVIASDLGLPLRMLMRSLRMPVPVAWRASSRRNPSDPTTLSRSFESRQDEIDTQEVYRMASGRTYRQHRIDQKEKRRGATISQATREETRSKELSCYRQLTSSEMQVKKPKVSRGRSVFRCCSFPLLQDPRNAKRL